MITIRLSAERGVMQAINGNCTTPVAAFGLRQGSELYLRAFLAEPDGTNPRRAETRVPFPENAESAAEIGHAKHVE